MTKKNTKIDTQPAARPTKATRDHNGKRCRLVRRLRTAGGKMFPAGTEFTIVSSRNGLFDLTDTKGYGVAHVRPDRVEILN